MKFILHLCLIVSCLMLPAHSLASSSNSAAHGITMDDSLHLYTNCRIALMLQKTDLADDLRAATSEVEMYEVFLETEKYFVETFVGK